MLITQQRHFAVDVESSPVTMCNVLNHNLFRKSFLWKLPEYFQFFTARRSTPCRQQI